MRLRLAHKAATVAAALCLLSTTAMILASHQGSRQLIHYSNALFAESLVAQLARDASNPLVQSDKLSLQSLLNNLLDSPLVVSGSIFDVANTVVAEAGPRHRGQSFSASITFQDGIAGYAIINIDNQTLYQQASLQRWLLAILALLLTAVVYAISLLFVQPISATLRDLAVMSRRPDPQQGRRAITPVAYSGQDELRALADDLSHQTHSITAHPAASATTPKVGNSALLVIEISNLHTLRQQLSASKVDHLLINFSQQLSTVCKLYDGQIDIIRGNSFSAEFHGVDDDDSYPFRALCSGYLISQWIDGQKPGFKLRLGLTLNTGTQLIGNHHQLAKQQRIEHALSIAASAEQGLCLSRDVEQHASVKLRANTLELSAQAWRLDSLNEPYQALLDRQLSTLRQQPSRP